jgi:succinate dehydrogenase/fumarate reductase cytochrome b subunit
LTELVDSSLMKMFSAHFLWVTKIHYANTLQFLSIQVLTAACMKMTVFWDVAPCSLVETDKRFRGACCLHHQVNGGRKHLWNVGILLPDFTVQ